MEEGFCDLLRSCDLKALLVAKVEEIPLNGSLFWHFVILNLLQLLLIELLGKDHSL